MEIRRSDDRLISTMGFPILVRWNLYIESGLRSFHKILEYFCQEFCQKLSTLVSGTPVGALPESSNFLVIHCDGVMQKKRKSFTSVKELCFSCTNPLM